MGYPTFNYPPAIRQEGGCKVGWLWYATRDEAEQASKVAVDEANHKAWLGYDFGYCVPGEIRETKDGLWRVTKP